MPNLPTDSSKKLPTVGGRGQKSWKVCRRLKWMVPYTNFGRLKVNKIRFFLVFKKSSVHFISSKSYHFHMKGIKAHSLNRLFFFWQYYFVEKTTKYLFLRQNWHHILHWYVDCRYRLFIGKKVEITTETMIRENAADFFENKVTRMIRYCLINLM